MEGRSSRLPASVLPTGELNNLQKKTQKRQIQKRQTHKRQTQKRQTHKRQIQKKTNTKKRQTQETYKTYLGLIRVPGGEGRGSGKRKKFQIFQLKEQEHQKVIRGANQQIIGHVFKDLMIISKG